MSEPTDIRIVVTDCGEILISAKTNAWLDATAPGWRESMYKPARSKAAKHARKQLDRLDIAAAVLAEIAWVNEIPMPEL